MVSGVLRKFKFLKSFDGNGLWLNCSVGASVWNSSCSCGIVFEPERIRVGVIRKCPGRRWWQQRSEIASHGAMSGGLLSAAVAISIGRISFSPVHSTRWRTAMKRIMIALVLISSMAATCTASRADDDHHHHHGRRQSSVGLSFSFGSGGDRFSASYGRGDFGRRDFGRDSFRHSSHGHYGSPYGHGGFGGPVYSPYPVYSVPVYHSGFYSVPVYGGSYGRHHGRRYCD